MGSMRGRYIWDDDNLRPGQKKEGGLHQNLFDDKGNLKGSARFIPDDGDNSGPIVVTETEYVTVEQRREGDDALEAAIDALVAHLLDRGIAIARPYAEQWWRETARPAIESRRAKASQRRSRRKAKKTGPVDGAAAASTPQELEPAPEATRPSMSTAEAQARYLAALAAQAYSQEQFRLVASATLIDTGGAVDLERSLAELPPEQVRGLLEAMATNPAMLGEETLAQLASTLGQLPGPGTTKQAIPSISPAPPKSVG